MFCALFGCLWAVAAPGAGAVLPSVAAVAAGISQERIARDIRTLEGFGTRDSNGLVEAPGRGIRAAQRWLESEFRQIPGLRVRLDTHAVKKGGRVVRDLEVVNIVAELPGAVDPGAQLVIGAHYDSLAFRSRPDSSSPDPELTAAAPRAPGASDNASGIACLLEIARGMASHQWPKTIVFIAFSGEEQGLFGSRGYAARAAAAKDRIEAMFNIDTIGTDVTGSGRQAGNRVHVFSGEPSDSPSRSLARYVKEMAERYVPALELATVFRADRFGRGGDHSPFEQHGFAAVRFTTPAEQLEKQHTEEDTFETLSLPYIRLVTRGVAAAVAALASAPSAPELLPLRRGASQYDSHLRWNAPASGVRPASYIVCQRATWAPFWEKCFSMGQSRELLLENVSIDEWTFGVRAVGPDGAESLIRPWTLPPNRFLSPATP